MIKDFITCKAPQLCRRGVEVMRSPRWFPVQSPASFWRTDVLMRKGWKGLTCVISWIYLIWVNSWDALKWPFPFSDPCQGSQTASFLRNWDISPGTPVVCTALSSDTTTCWLSKEIIHTYKMNEVRTTVSIRNLSWAIWRHSSGRNLCAQIGQVCIQPSDLNIPRYVFCLHMGKHMFSQFQRLVWKKSIFFWYLAENLFI